MWETKPSFWRFSRENKNIFKIFLANRFFSLLGDLSNVSFFNDNYLRLENFWDLKKNEEYLEMTPSETKQGTNQILWFFYSANNMIKNKFFIR